MNEIFIDVGFSESRVAVIDEGELAEIYIDRQSRERIAGNIYKGRIENVLPGMQAAFVDIGFEKNAFLYVKDAIDYGAVFHENCTKEEIPICNLLKAGDELLVQVSKEQIGSKGARVTTHITLPGRYIVLMPNVNYIGISRRIESANERDRLKGIISKLKPKNMGIIIRTEAEGKESDDFIEDIDFLIKLYAEINNDAVKSGAPRLIHKDLGLVYKSIRDLFNRETKRVVINEINTYKKIVELFSPELKNKFEYYSGGANILGFYGIEEKIEKALSKKVWLKCGGYIIIDQTEALTSIDVNTGKYTGCSSLKDTVLLTNIEAAGEIARQLRLRDIGGIIIIDFIDMVSYEHRNMVLAALKSGLKKDRTKSSVLGITELGLVEMTRKKMGKRLSSIMQKSCPLCQGSGRVIDEESIVRKLERELARIFKETDVDTVLVEVNDSVEKYINECSNDYIRFMEDNYNKKIYIKGLYNMQCSEIKIKMLSGNSKEGLNTFEVGDKIVINAVKSKYLNASARYNTHNGKVEKVIYDENGSIDKIIIDILE